MLSACDTMFAHRASQAHCRAAPENVPDVEKHSPTTSLRGKRFRNWQRDSRTQGQVSIDHGRCNQVIPRSLQREKGGTNGNVKT